MATKGQPEAQAPIFTEPCTEMHAKILEAVSAFAQANQRVVGELIELSSAAAKEGLQAYAELQSAAVEAARAMPFGTIDPRETLAELRQDPFAWYRKSLLLAVDGTQRAFRLLEANTQIVTRSAERFQASAERTGKEVQETLTSYMGRMKAFSGRN